jgi:hypothetical protein
MGLSTFEKTHETLARPFVDRLWIDEFSRHSFHDRNGPIFHLPIFQQN